MKMRKGQVAVYLALVLVALMILVLMNGGIYLSVSARNKTMHAGDAAALAVARHQGELLNEIGSRNIEHLQAALKGDATRCEEIEEEVRRLAFLGPLEGIRLGNEAARNNGAEESESMRQVLLNHVFDIRLVYDRNPDLYPAPWEGAWEDYARELETLVGGGVWAGVDNIDFLDAAENHLLYKVAFYQAVAGRNWCWFFFEEPNLLDSYSSYRDWPPLPYAVGSGRTVTNSEIYSLHLDARQGSAVELLGTNVIKRLTNASLDDIEKSTLLNDPAQTWMFYETESSWRDWAEMSVENGFPAIGPVRDEYDVLGCAAVCRVTRAFPRLVHADDSHEAVWTAAAKCFGTVVDEKGDLAPVTALRGFVVGGFTASRLIPIDAALGGNRFTADADWMTHVRKHLPIYLVSGPTLFPACWYCRQLVVWENESVREQGRYFLKFNSSTCVRPTGGHGVSGRGGSAHGH